MRVLSSRFCCGKRWWIVLQTCERPNLWYPAYSLSLISSRLHSCLWRLPCRELLLWQHVGLNIVGMSRAAWSTVTAACAARSGRCAHPPVTAGSGGGSADTHTHQVPRQRWAQTGCAVWLTHAVPCTWRPLTHICGLQSGHDCALHSVRLTIWLWWIWRWVWFWWWVGVTDVMNVGWWPWWVTRPWVNKWGTDKWVWDAKSCVHHTRDAWLLQIWEDR